MKNNFLKGKNIKNRFLAVSMASLILASSFPANTIAYVPMNTAMDVITQATENDENILKELTKDANSQVLVIRDGSFTYKLKVFVNKHVNFVEGIVDETDTVNGVYGSVAMIWGQFKGENKGLKKYGGKTFGEIKAMPKPDDIIVMVGQKDEIPNKVHKKILEFIATEEAKEGKAEREKKNELARSLYKYRYRYVHKDTKIWDEVTLSQFLESYDKARTVLEKSNPSDSEISERIRDLETKYNAIKAAPFSDAKFKELVSQAEEKINNKDHYTLSTMAELQRVLAEVRNDYNNGKIKNLLDMNITEEKLQKALDQLVTKEESKRRFTINGEILQYGNESEKSMANQFMDQSILLIEEDNAKIYEVTFKKGSFQGITAEVEGLKYDRENGSWQNASLVNTINDTRTFRLIMPKSEKDKIHIKTLAYMGGPELAEQDAVLKLNLSTKRPEGSQLEDGNKQKLKEFIDSIQELNKDINEGVYKEPKSTEFKNKYIEATKLLEANQVTDDAIDAIIRAIRIIKQDLVLKAVDEFAQKLGKAEEITTDKSSKEKYTETSLAKLKEAVDAGNAVWTKRYDQTKEEIERLIDLLDAATNDLKEKGEEEQEKVIENIEYTAPVKVMHAYDEGKASMANGAIVSPAKLTYIGDKVKIELTFNGMTLWSMKGHLTNLFYYKNNQAPVQGGEAVETTITKKFMDLGLDGKEHEYPREFSFTIDKELFEKSEFLWCKVWVDAMDGIAGKGPGGGAQNAKIVIDKNKKEEIKPILNKEELTNLITEASSIEKGDKTEEAFEKLKKAIKHAQESLATIDTKEKLESAKKQLQMAIDEFKASPAEVKEAKNKPELEKLLHEQDSLYQDILKGEYKEEGSKLYLDKYKEAIKLLEDPKAKEEDIDNVIRSLKAIRQNKLVLKILDIFQDLIVRAEEISNKGNTDKKYIEDSFKKLSEAVVEANKYWNNRHDQPKEKIESLNKMLKEALDGLKEVPKVELNKNALINKIAEAKKIEQDKKTDEAFNALKAAITAAEKVLKEATDQTQLDEAVTKLKVAVEAFSASPNKESNIEFVKYVKLNVEDGGPTDPKIRNILDDYGQIVKIDGVEHLRLTYFSVEKRSNGLDYGTKQLKYSYDESEEKIDAIGKVIESGQNAGEYELSQIDIPIDGKSEVYLFGEFMASIYNNNKIPGKAIVRFSDSDIQGKMLGNIDEFIVSQKGFTQKEGTEKLEFDVEKDGKIYTPYTSLEKGKFKIINHGSGEIAIKIKRNSFLLGDIRHIKYTLDGKEPTADSKDAGLRNENKPAIGFDKYFVIYLPYEDVESLKETGGDIKVRFKGFNKDFTQSTEVKDVTVSFSKESYDELKVVKDETNNISFKADSSREYCFTSTTTLKVENINDSELSETFNKLAEDKGVSGATAYKLSFVDNNETAKLDIDKSWDSEKFPLIKIKVEKEGADRNYYKNTVFYEVKNGKLVQIPYNYMTKKASIKNPESIYVIGQKNYDTQLQEAKEALQEKMNQIETNVTGNSLAEINLKNLLEKAKNASRLSLDNILALNYQMDRNFEIINEGKNTDSEINKELAKELIKCINSDIYKEIFATDFYNQVIEIKKDIESKLQSRADLKDDLLKLDNLFKDPKYALPYKVTSVEIKRQDRDEPSMAGGCFMEEGRILYGKDENYLLLNLKTMSPGFLNAHLLELSVFKDRIDEDKLDVMSIYKYSDVMSGTSKLGIFDKQILVKLPKIEKDTYFIRVANDGMQGAAPGARLKFTAKGELIEDEPQAPLQKEALTKEIEAAKEIAQGKKTEEAFAKLKAAITSAEGVLNSATEQNQLDDALANLKKAIETFKSSPDKQAQLNKTDLNAKIQEASNITQGNKSEDAFKALNAAIEAAKNVLNSANTQDQINEALSNLNKAIDTFNNSTDVNITPEVNEKVYNIPVKLMHSVQDKESMGNKALVSPAKVSIKGDVVNIDLNFQGIEVPLGTTKFYGHLTNLFSFKDNTTRGEAIPAEVLEQMEDNAMDGSRKQFPKVFRIKLTKDAFDNLKDNTLYVKVWVDAMDGLMGGTPGAGAQNARLVFDKSNMTEVNPGEETPTPPIPTPDLSNRTAVIEALRSYSNFGGPQYTYQSNMRYVNAYNSLMNLLSKPVVTESEVKSAIDELKSAAAGLVLDTSKSNNSGNNQGWGNNNQGWGNNNQGWGNNNQGWGNNNQNNNQNNQNNGPVTIQYEVPVEVLQAYQSGYSMANAAINHTARVEERNGQFRYSVNFHSIQREFGGKTLTGNLTDLFIVDGSKYRADQSGSTWSWIMNGKYDRVNVAVWVDAMDEIAGKGPGGGEQNAILSFNWNGAKEVGRVGGNNNQQNQQAQSQSSKSSGSSNSFTDINGHWAKQAIDYVVGKGYFFGLSNAEFGPNKSITRGQFVTVLGRMLNVNTSIYSAQNFNDVKSSMYYSSYIAWANKMGIVSGVGQGRFAPDKELTREEMAVIMSKFLKVSNKSLKAKGNSNGFMDDGKIESWAKEAVKEMAKLGVVNGMGDGKFAPKSPFTRAQVAQVLFNIDHN